MDKVEQIYNLYLNNGLISDAISLDVFRSADLDQQQKLFELGKEKGLFQTSTIEDFASAWSLKKKEDTVSVSEDGLLEQQEIVEQPEIAEEDGDALKKFKANALEMASGIARIPMLVAENAINAATAFNPELQSYLDDLPLEERENFISSIANAQGGVMGMTGASNEAARKLKQRAEEIQKTITQYDTGITEDIFSENIGRGLSRLLDEAVGTVPSLALAFIPGGIAVIGAGSAAEKSRALQEKGEALDYKTFINAVGSGTAEGIFENYTRKLIPKSIFKQLAGKTKEQVLVTAKTIGNALLKGFGIEGSSETATLLSQKILDAWVTGDEEAFVNIVGEALDTFLVGGIVGAPLNTLSPGVKAYAQRQQKKSINNSIDKSKYKDIVEAFQIEKGKPSVELDQLDIISSANSRLFLEGTLAKRVKNNTLSEAEATEILNAYDNAASLVYETSNLDISPDRKVEAMLLVDEKRKLENLIAGKDQALSKKERIRIDEINDTLEKISLESGAELSIKEATKEDAIKALQEEGILEPSDEQIFKKLDELTKKEKDAVQESSTETLPLPDQPRVGEKVGERDATREITGEITQEESQVAEVPKEEVAEPVEEQEGKIIIKPGAILDFAPVSITLKKPVKDGPNEILTGRDAELEAEVIERKLNNAKQRGTNPELVVASLQRRLALEQNEAEIFADYIENFLAGKVTTPFSEWIKGRKKESFETKRIKITEPFTVGRSRVIFNEDGTIKSVVSVKTGKEVTAATRSKVEKIILEKVIDVDSGEKASVVEGLRPEQFPQYIADESSNVREVAQAIKDEEARIKQEQPTIEFIEEAQKLDKLKDVVFTKEDLANKWDEKLVNENSSSGRNIRRYWTKPATDRFGRPTRGLKNLI